MPLIRLAMAQTNPTVGDFSGNLRQIIDSIETAVESEASLIVFGEMAMCGYPIEDLALSVDFIRKSEDTLGLLIQHLQHPKFANIAVVVGHLAAAKNQEHGWAIAQNVASVIIAGNLVGSYAKHHLPNYSVFDEYRNFVPGNQSLTFSLQGVQIGVLICEDIWQVGGPSSKLSEQKVDLALVLNGSPFEQGKHEKRLEQVGELVKSQDCATVYVNLVGGQDDLVFDGGSFLMLADGEVPLRAKEFETSVAIVDFRSKNEAKPISQTHSKHEPLGEIWQALVLGLRDYVRKNGFPGVVLGLSGGIDSAVCATLAADALGPAGVVGVTMPSEHSSEHSLTDARDLANRLSVEIRNQPIQPMVNLFEQNLGLSGVSAENVQARVRGVILMGIANQDGLLTLSTGNKTEIAVGYSTIYGDTVGGFAPLKDVPKTLIWRLAEWRNRQAIEEGKTPPIPENSISKPPSAELRPGQVDQDSLPAYEDLDAMLELLIERRLDTAQVVAEGYDSGTVEQVAKLVKNAEWKRKQGAIGTKISSLAFGRDRRMPITNRYEG